MERVRTTYERISKQPHWLSYFSNNIIIRLVLHFKSQIRFGRKTEYCLHNHRINNADYTYLHPFSCIRPVTYKSPWIIVIFHLRPSPYCYWFALSRLDHDVHTYIHSVYSQYTLTYVVFIVYTHSLHVQVELGFRGISFCLPNRHETIKIRICLLILFETNWNAICRIAVTSFSSVRDYYFIAKTDESSVIFFRHSTLG